MCRILALIQQDRDALFSHGVAVLIAAHQAVALLRQSGATLNAA
jgi:hypothetical protein